MAKQPLEQWDHDYALLEDLVEQCTVCKETRKALNALRNVEYDCDLRGEVEIPGIEDMRVQCCCCKGSGYLLTAKGKALLKLITELAPFKPEEKEIPF